MTNNKNYKFEIGYSQVDLGKQSSIFTANKTQIYQGTDPSGQVYQKRNYNVS